MECKICNNETVFFDSAMILNKYNVKYFRCPKCGTIQTEKPYWLEEAYSNAIADSDIGVITRNYINSENLKRLFSILFSGVNSFLDYGGGYGIFTRRMRDLGFDFEWYDQYCNNIFAKGHEKSKEHYDVITSFEMFEHLENPIETCKKIFSLADNLVFSTELLPDPNPKVNDWWYYCVDHGQHIIFYTKESLQEIARQYSKHYYCFEGIHFFMNRKIKYTTILKIKFSSFFYSFFKMFFLQSKRESLLNKDYEKITGKII